MIDFKDNDYQNGFLERKYGGKYEGNLTIDGVNISPIEGIYFKDEKTRKNHLWIKRKPLLEYSFEYKEYKQREREPRWETYLVQKEGTIAYEGEFLFLKFKYKIYGIWDKVMTDRYRLNLFVERLPLSSQSIINSINERNKGNYESGK